MYSITQVAAQPHKFIAWHLKMDHEGEAGYGDKDFLNIILCRACSLKASTEHQAGFLSIVFHEVFLIHWWC